MPSRNDETPATQSGAAVTESEGDTAAEGGTQIEPNVLSGSMLPERLLPSGILEIGDRDAPHSLLLVTEHHCRYCRDFLSEHVPLLEEQFITPGLLRLSIVTLHLRKYPGSPESAAGLHCASTQGKGLLMHRLLFERPSSDRSSLLSYARELGLDTELYGTCLSDAGTKSALAAQQAWLRSLDVTLVPTYFIDGVKYTGLPYGPDLIGQIREVTEQ